MADSDRIEMGRDDKGDFVFRGPRLSPDLYSGSLWPELRSRLVSFGDRTALVNPYTGEELSYSRVLSLAERLSRGLYKLGLRQGKSLSIFAPNSVESALLTLATHATGGILTATNPASMPSELKRHLELSEASILATTPELLPLVSQATDGLHVRIIVIGPRQGQLNFDDLVALGSEDVTFTLAPVDPSQTIACMLFSSGTTGLPKAVEITQTNLVSWFYIFQALDGGMLSERDTILLHLPFFHSYGQNITMLAGLAFGCRLVVMGKFDLNHYLRFIVRYRVTALFTVPPVVIGMLNHPHFSDFDLSSLRFVSCGAAPLVASVVACTTAQSVECAGAVQQCLQTLLNNVVSYTTQDEACDGVNSYVSCVEDGCGNLPADAISQIQDQIDQQGFHCSISGTAAPSFSLLLVPVMAALPAVIRKLW